MLAIRHKLLIMVIELPAPNNVAMLYNRALDNLVEMLVSTSKQPKIQVNEPNKYNDLWPKIPCDLSMSRDDTNDAKNETIGTVAICSTLVSLPSARFGSSESWNKRSFNHNGMYTSEVVVKIREKT